MVSVKMTSFKLFGAFLFLYFLSTVLGGSTPAINYSAILSNNSSTCVKSIKQIDGLIKRILLMDRNRALPVDEKSKEEWCSPLKQLPRTGKIYQRCAPKFIGTIARVFLNSVKKPIKAICKSPIERSGKHFRCIDRNYILQVRLIETKLVDALITLNSDTVPRDKVLPGICCTIHSVLERIKFIKHKPCPDPTANPNKFIYDRINEAVHDVVDLICGPYPSKKVCDEKNSDILVLLEKYEKGARDLTNEPFISNLLEIVASLANSDDA